MTKLSEVILYDVIGSRPAAGTAGRLFYATDTQVLSRDNGSSWDNLTISSGVTSAHINVSQFEYLPSPGTAGDVYLTSNGVALYRSDGVSQDPWGPIFPFTQPDNSIFSWLNQVGASVDTTKGGIYLAAAVENPCQTHARSIALPAAPYTVTVALLPNILDYKFRYGLALFDNTGKYAALDMENSEVIQIINVASLTATGWSSPGGNWGFNGGFGQLTWLRVRDDSFGNRSWWFSMDGQHFNLVYNESTTAYITPTKVGFYVTGTNTLGATSGVTLLSWKVE